MNILLLPGISLGNEEWIDRFGAYCKGKFGEVIAIHYDHWVSGEQLADVEKETQKAIEEVEGWEDYVIVAKSIGCVVATKMLKKLKNQPKYVVMVGFPLSLVENKFNDILNLLNDVQTKLIFVQKLKDPACSFATLKVFLEKLNIKNYKAIEYVNPKEPIDNHHYESYKKLVEIIKSESGE
ncbi:MAG: hypothetical protein ABIC57_02765 [bacterium]